MNPSLEIANNFGNMCDPSVKNHLEFQCFSIITKNSIPLKIKPTYSILIFSLFLQMRTYPIYPPWGLIHIHPYHPLLFLRKELKQYLPILILINHPGLIISTFYILKHCAHVIAPILKIIFTQSMSSDSLPTDWLTANITPILKKGNRSSPSNYRPISLTSICCKSMEHIICHHIMEHLQKNHILTDQQHGFRHGFSCQAQLVALLEDLLHNMDNRCQIDLIFLNFAKAFD